MEKKIKNTEEHVDENKSRISYYAPEISLVIGLLCICVGLVSLIGNYKIFNFLLSKDLKLSPTSKSYEMWRETPIPMYIEFYFFNWTNPEKLGKEKPTFTEMGPYRYYEKEKKVNIVWNENGTISYMKRNTWYFDEENTIGSQDDNLTTLNPIALAAASTVRNWNMIMKKSLSMGLGATGQKIFIRKKIREVLFEGYQDKLIDLARSMPSFQGVDIPFDRFGWFYSRNGSENFEGYFNIDTGANNFNNVGMIKSWNYSNRTIYNNEGCNFVEGSAGEFWPSNHKRETPLTMFSSNLRRSISFNYAEDREVEGITGYTYVLNEHLIDNGTLDAENSCYCHGECYPSGLLNLTSAYYGTPSFISYPHFYLADPYYSNLIDGMKPDQRKHQFYITLEPTVGIPLEVAARFQINLLLSPIKGVRLYSDVPTIYFPMIWFNQKARMTPELASSIKTLIGLPRIITTISIATIILGIFITTLGVVLNNSRKKKGLNVIHYDGTSINTETKVNEPHSRTPLFYKPEATQEEDS